MQQEESTRRRRSEYLTATCVFRPPQTYDLPSYLTVILSRYFLVPTESCNWLSFQYVPRFVLEKSPLPTLCFQKVARFVPFRDLPT